MRESGGGFSGGFYDGESVDERRPVRLVLERVVTDGNERFRMHRRIARHDHAHRLPHIVPADTERFESDLTSVPPYFAWLVPRTGVHLPAALLHDALVVEPPNALGPVVDRIEADRIFRDAMGDLGTSLLRRWLMWTAVVLATIHRGRIGHRWWYRAVMYGSLSSIGLIGIGGTLAVFGRAEWFPGIGAATIDQRLLEGARLAVIVPAVMAPLWGRLWRAGMIAGWALAALIHVTLVIAVSSSVFWALDRAIERLVGIWSVGDRRRQLAATLGGDVGPGGGELDR